MLRFIDLSKEYWTDPMYGSPICAFLSTSDDRFLQSLNGTHTFSSLEEIREHPQASRMEGLMPMGFFDKEPDLDRFEAIVLDESSMPTESFEDRFDVHGERRRKEQREFEQRSKRFTTPPPNDPC